MNKNSKSVIKFAFAFIATISLGAASALADATTTDFSGVDFQGAVTGSSIKLPKPPKKPKKPKLFTAASEAADTAANAQEDGMAAKAVAAADAGVAAPAAATDASSARQI